MCGRFFISEANDGQLAALIGDAAKRQTALTGEDTVARGEVSPGAVVPALAAGKSGNIGAYPLQWGFHRADGKGLIINTRSETAMERPLFKASMRERRCLIPCSWYFEWEVRDAQPSLLDAATSLQIRSDGPTGGKRRPQLRVKYAIRPRRPGLMYLAGIYRYEADRRLPVFSILTRAPAPEIAFIHDRMPVIFSEANYRTWLDGSADPVEALQQCETAMIFRAT